MRVFFSAGEASGDALGAPLIAALRARRPDLEVFGMGGPQMERAGLEVWRRSEELNVVGLSEVLRHLPRLYRLLWDLARRAAERRPDLAVLIDVPDFNIRLARHLRRAGIPVIGYVGPSVWAWRAGRVARWRREMQRLLLLYPFETELWAKAGMDARCVGHPLLDQIPTPRDEAAVEEGTVALLPGSRVGEVQRIFPTQLGAAARLHAAGRARRFLVPAAPTLDPRLLRREIDAFAPELTPHLELIVSAPDDPGPRRRAIAQAALAIVASGTATLETALIGTPQIIVYRLSPLTWWLGRPFVKVDHLGLPNLIAGRAVVPELLQDNLQVEPLFALAAAILDDPSAQRAALQELRGRLGPAGGADRAAEAILELGS